MAESTTSTTSILCLPPEVLEMIFKMLDVPDKCRCARVCVDWYKATCSKRVWSNSSFTWTPNVDLSDDSTVRDSLISRDIQRLAIEINWRKEGQVPLDGVIPILPMVKSLNIDHYNMTDDIFCQPSLLQSLPQLTELTIANGLFITANSVKMIALNFTNLVSLEFNGANPTKVTNDCLMLIARNLGKLTRLTLDRCFRITDSGIAHLTRYGPVKDYTLPRLQHLQLGMISGLTNTSMFYLSIGQPYLKYLCLHGTVLVNNIGFAQLGCLKHLQELVFLPLCPIDEISEINYRASFGHLQVLRLTRRKRDKKLELRKVAKMDNLSVLELHSFNIRTSQWRRFAKMPNLHHMSLHKCTINDASLKVLADGGSRVVRLDIVGGRHKNMTDEGLQQIARLTHLRELSLMNCSAICGPGLAYLSQGVAKITNLKLKGFQGKVALVLLHLARMNDLRTLAWFDAEMIRLAIQTDISSFKIQRPDVDFQLKYLGLFQNGLELELKHLQLCIYD